MFDYIGTEDLKKLLLGRKVEKIFFNEDYLKFETDGGSFVFGVSGDCCSSSIFYDFYGVKNLLENGEIVDAKTVDLTPDDIKEMEYGHSDKKGEHDQISVYGFQLTTKNKKFGEVTSVFSFRNYSNGYYGGSMYLVEGDKDVAPQIKADVVEAATPKRD